MRTEFIDTLIIGGGQAGLAMSHMLSQRGCPNIVVERHRPQNVMSALPPKADICGANAHVCYGPEADITGLFGQRERAAMEARLDRALWRS